MKAELAESLDTCTGLSKEQRTQQASAADLQSQLAALRDEYAAAEVRLISWYLLLVTSSNLCCATGHLYASHEHDVSSSFACRQVTQQEQRSWSRLWLQHCPMQQQPLPCTLRSSAASASS